jgi:hypothetical protein
METTKDIIYFKWTVHFADKIYRWIPYINKIVDGYYLIVRWDHHSYRYNWVSKSFIIFSENENKWYLISSWRWHIHKDVYDCKISQNNYIISLINSWLIWFQNVSPTNIWKKIYFDFEK